MDSPSKNLSLTGKPAYDGFAQDFILDRRAHQAEKAAAKTKKKKKDSGIVDTLMRYIGVIGDEIVEIVNKRTRPRVFYDRNADILYVGDEKFGGKTFMYFGVNHYFRKGAIMLLCDPWVRRSVIVLILVHSLSVLFLDPTNREAFASNTTFLDATLLILDRALLLVFTVELCLRALSIGVRRSLTNPFVVLDMLIIVVSFLLDVVPPTSPVMTYLYALNSLRPVRAIQRISNMKKLVLVVYASAGDMGSVLVLILCLVFLFAMVGIILFGRMLHSRCVAEDGSLGNVCSVTGLQLTNNFLFTPCPKHQNCSDNESLPPPGRWNNYDNIGYALLLTIQVITLDEWTTIAENVMDGFTPFAGIFYVALTLIGTYWALNLLLAVITDAFSRFFAEEKLENETRDALAKGLDPTLRKKPQLSVALTGGVVEDESNEPPLMQVATADGASHVLLSAKGTAPLVRRQWKRWVGELSVASSKSLVGGLHSIDADSLFSEKLHEEQMAKRRKLIAEMQEPGGPDADTTVLLEQEHSRQQQLEELLKANFPADELPKLRSILEWRRGIEGTEAATSGDRVALQGEWDVPLLYVPDGLDEDDSASSFGEMIAPVNVHDRAQQLFDKRANLLDASRRLREKDDEDELLLQQEINVRLERLRRQQEKYGGGLFGKYFAVFKGENATDLWNEVEEEGIEMEGKQEGAERNRSLSVLQSDLMRKLAANTSCRELMYTLMCHRYHDIIMQGVVFFNVLMFATIYYGMPSFLLVFIEFVTVIVDVIVVADCIIRISLSSLRKFMRVVFRSFYNMVEFGVVILCLMDLTLVVTGMFPTLKIFRVFRVLKYMKRFSLLRRIVQFIQSSLAYLVNQLGLLFIFTVVFTVCGRHIFSGQGNVEIVECFTIDERASCNAEDYCVWINESLWMDPLFAEYESLKTEVATRSVSFSQAATPSELRTPSRTSHSLGFPDDAGPNNETESRTLQLGALQQTQSVSGGAGNRGAAPDYDPPTGAPTMVPGSRVSCRQFTGWDSVGEADRFTFSTFYFAFITIFDLMTLDNWSDITYRYMSAFSWLSCVFFIVVVAVGGYILAALLVAIMLVNFGKEDQLNASDDEDDQDGEMPYVKDTETAVLEAVQDCEDEFGRGEANEQTILDRVKKGFSAALENFGGKNKKKRKGSKMVPEGEGDEEGGLFPEDEDPDTSEEEQDADGALQPNLKVRSKAERRWRAVVTFCTTNFVARMVKAIALYMYNLCDFPCTVLRKRKLKGRSFFFFSATNKFRLIVRRIVVGRYFHFEKVVFLLSLLHLIVTPVNNRLFVSPTAILVFLITDWIISVLFVFEMSLRLMAQGAFLRPYSYWHSSALNKIEFVTVTCSFLALLLPVMIPVPLFEKIGFSLKAIRPSRILVRSQAMKNVFSAVWRTLRPMMHVLGLIAAVYLIASVISVELFNGRLRRCNDNSDRSESECIGFWLANADDGVVLLANETDIMVPRRWTNVANYHFDNVFNAFVTLMEVSMASRWSQVMFSMMDAPQEPGGPPRRLQSYNSAWFFVLWVFISFFFLINIFVGTVVDQFMRLKSQVSGSVFLTEEQTELAQIRKLLHQTEAKKVLSVPATPFLSHELNVMCHTIVSNKWFRWFMTLCVLFNVLIITTSHYQQERVWTLLQIWGNVAVSIIFTIEFALKVGVSGFGPYVAIGFHRLDLIVVVQSWIEIGLFIFVPGYAEQQTLQLFRLFRVLRLMREQKGFRRLIHTGFRSLPAMGNIGALLALVFYSFAIVGIALFEDSRYDPSSKTFLNMNLNFRSFPRAVFALYKVATLDDWGDISNACGLSVPYCESGVDCGDKVQARLYFGVFVIVVAYVMLNLFIAVVLENFSESVLLPTYMRERMQDINLFRSKWAAHDPAGRQVLPAAAFVPVLKALPGPRKRLIQLQKQQGNDSDDHDSICSWTQDEIEYYAAHCAVGLDGEPLASVIPTLRQLNLPMTWPAQEVLFADAIDAIGEKVFHVKLVDQKTAIVHEKARALAIELRTSWEIVHYYCAVIIQNAWRQWKYEKEHPSERRKTYGKWSQVLAPILRQVYAHHAEGVFDEDESEEAAAKYRRMIRGHRRRGLEQQIFFEQQEMEQHQQGGDGGEKEGEASTMESGSPQQRHIKQKMSLADALQAKMAEMDGREVEKEDDSWRYAITECVSEGSTDVSLDDEDFWLTAEAREQKKKAFSGAGLGSSGSEEEEEAAAAAAAAKQLQERERARERGRTEVYRRAGVKEPPTPRQTKESLLWAEQQAKAAKDRRKEERREKRKQVTFDLPLRSRLGDTAYQLPTLSELIQRRKKQLLVEARGAEKKRGRGSQGDHVTLEQLVASQSVDVSKIVGELPHNRNSTIPISSRYRRKWQPLPQPPPPEDGEEAFTVAPDEVEGALLEPAKTSVTFGGLEFSADPSGADETAKMSFSNDSFAMATSTVGGGGKVSEAQRQIDLKRQKMLEQRARRRASGKAARPSSIKLSEELAAAITSPTEVHQKEAPTVKSPNAVPPPPHPQPQPQPQPPAPERMPKLSDFLLVKKNKDKDALSSSVFRRSPSYDAPPPPSTGDRAVSATIDSLFSRDRDEEKYQQQKERQQRERERQREREALAEEKRSLEALTAAASKAAGRGVAPPSHLSAGSTERSGAAATGARHGARVNFRGHQPPPSVHSHHSLQ